MDFFIRKNSTLPLLKIQVVKDGRSDYNNFMDYIEQSAIFFTMVDVETGIPRIVSRPAGFVTKTGLNPNASPEYYVYYQFSSNETKKPGRYEGQFLFRNEDEGTLILPIREKLFINIEDSFIADDLPYESCYVSEFPCCLKNPITPVTTTTTTEEIPFVVDIQTIITSGSVVFDFVVTLPMVLTVDFEFTMSKTFNTTYGDAMIVTTDILIPAGELSITKRVVVDDDYNRITYGSDLVDVTYKTELSGFKITEVVKEEIFIIPPTPTPTPTNTPTPTPTNTPTSTVTPTPGISPSVTPTNTPTPTPTNTPTPSPIVLSKEILFGKLSKQRMGNNDYVGFSRVTIDSVINKHYEFPNTQGYCYFMIPSYMEQPNIFRNSNDGCDGFIVPFIRVEDQQVVDSQGNIIIYYVYRSFVSTFASVDVWVCD